MTFTIDKVQACEIFVKKALIFHPAARIRAVDLYSKYKNFLEKIELQSSSVEKHNFWSLLKQVVPRDVLEFLDKRTYRDLYYVGVDLKEHGLSPDQLKKLEGLSYQSGGFQVKGCENTDLKKDVNTNLLGENDPSTIMLEVEDREMLNKNIGPRGPKKRGRPRKNLASPVLEDESNG